MIGTLEVYSSGSNFARMRVHIYLGTFYDIKAYRLLNKEMESIIKSDLSRTS
jgi:hypothetical protein